MYEFAIVLTMHRQIVELHTTATSIEKFCDNKCHLFVHSNGNISVIDIVKKFTIPTSFLWTNTNSGYSNGPMDAMNMILPILKNKKYVCALHLHPDVFIINNELFKQKFVHFCLSNYTMGMSKWMGSNWHWSFDFFMFKPSKLPTNVFERYMSGSVERQLSNSLKKNNISILSFNRFKDDKFFTNRTDNIGLSHQIKN